MSFSQGRLTTREIIHNSDVLEENVITSEVNGNDLSTSFIKMQNVFVNYSPATELWN